MKNFVQTGDVLSLTAPAALASGAGFLVGTIFAVACGAAASGAPVEGRVSGVFELPKAAGEITQGAAVYWDNTAKNVTTTSTDNTLIGKATETAASGAAIARVRLSNEYDR